MAENIYWNHGMKNNRSKKPVISVNKKKTVVTLNVPPDPYQIEMRRIPTRTALELWEWRISEKEWSTPDLIGEFYRTVCDIKGWNAAPIDAHRVGDEYD